VGRAAEDSLGKSSKVDLLAQVPGMLCEQFIGSDTGGKLVEGREVAAVEGEKKVAEPGVVFGFLQHVKDGVEEELAEVVDAGRHKRGEAEVVGAAVALVGGEGIEIYAGEVEESVTVVCSKVGFPLLWCQHQPNIS